MNGPCLAAIILAAWNTLVFALYGLDKRRARQQKRRISEKTLLLAAALLGTPGALLGMGVFRHKTRKLKFRLGIPLLCLLQIAALYLIFTR